MTRRLYRSETNRMFGGVCGGFGEYFGIDPTIVRVLAVLLTLTIGLGVLAYIVLWIIIPTQSRINASPRQTVRHGVEDVKERAIELGQEAKAAFKGKEPQERAAAPESKDTPDTTQG